MLVAGIGWCMPTEDMEFFDPLAPDSGFEWQQAPGYPEGMGHELVLYSDDEGRQTRFLRLQPGTETEDVITHDFYEEVYVIKGGFIDKRLDEAFTAGMYACRTPGMEHGPYKAPIGVLSIELRYKA
jgi:anti-sigma factor ChrR (cupin superfamily)